jgi:hypothetical protein
MEAKMLEIENPVKVVVIEESLVYSFPTNDPHKKHILTPKIGDQIELPEEIVEVEMNTGNVRRLFDKEEEDISDDELENDNKKKKNKKTKVNKKSSDDKVGNGKKKKKKKVIKKKKSSE